MNLVRIWVIASNCFREVIRDRILYFIGFFALLLAIALRLLPEVSANTEDKIFLDFGLGAIGLLSALVAIFVGTGLINKEIEKHTVLVMIPKPISRAEFIIGKHLGLSGVLAVMVAVMLMIYLGLLSFAKISYPLVSLLVSVLYLFIELALLTAVAITFGVFTSSILGTLMSCGIYLMGHISGDLLEFGKLSKNENIEFLTQTLYLVLPDLSRLNLRNEAVYGLLPSLSELLSHALYGVTYTGLLLAIAILIFSRRQF
ncbi:MAG: ABC transporter permease [Moorea sp. SIO2B7]|nr:ABC transporter permease [Moorena sp. SIO2B7]